VKVILINEDLGLW